MNSERSGSAKKVTFMCPNCRSQYLLTAWPHIEKCGNCSTPNPPIIKVKAIGKL